MSTTNRLSAYCDQTTAYRMHFTIILTVWPQTKRDSIIYMLSMCVYYVADRECQIVELVMGAPTRPANPLQLPSLIHMCFTDLSI